MPIEPPYSRFPLGIVSVQFFILWPSDRGDRLFFCCAACDLFLNGIADVHQHLSEALEPLSGFPRVCGDGTMSRHEDLGPQRFDRIQRLQPVEAVTVVDKEEPVGEEELAQIDNAILGNIDDAVPSRVAAATYRS